jgi:hypothetical protein
VPINACSTPESRAVVPRAAIRCTVAKLLLTANGESFVPFAGQYRESESCPSMNTCYRPRSPCCFLSVFCAAHRSFLPKNLPYRNRAPRCRSRTTHGSRSGPVRQSGRQSIGRERIQSTRLCGCSDAANDAPHREGLGSATASRRWSPATHRREERDVLSELGNGKAFSVKVLSGQVWSAVRGSPTKFEVRTPSSITRAERTPCSASVMTETNQSMVSTGDGNVTVSLSSGGWRGTVSAGSMCATCGSRTEHPPPRARGTVTGCRPKDDVEADPRRKLVQRRRRSIIL